MESDSVILNKLLELKDDAYADFEARLIPTLNRSDVIGVRTPALRKYAKELWGADVAERFMRRLPHRYLEENNLHAILISRIRDYDMAVTAVEAFLPYVDNWATCDIMSPKVFSKHTDRLYPRIVEWVGAERPFTIRFGIKMLMSFYLGAHFDKEHLKLVASVPATEYYAYMMIAWYFATALAKQFDATLPFIENKLMDPCAHNKTIQKALESYRITEEQKTLLRTLRL